jgi:hypothetical protein
MTEAPGWFTEWHERFFQGHSDADIKSHERVTTLEQEFKSLMNLIKVSVAIIVLFGGTTVTVAVWAFHQTVGEVKDLQKAVTSIATTQAILVERDRLMFEQLKK